MIEGRNLERERETEREDVCVGVWKQVWVFERGHRSVEVNYERSILHDGTNHRQLRRESTKVG